MKLHTIESNVSSILASFPKTRSCDRLLQAIYLEMFHGITTFQQHCDDPDAPPTESIRRCRQKIQADGRYTATGEVKGYRAEQEDLFLDYVKAA